MTKEVLLSIRGLQIAPDEQKDTVEVYTPGQYYFRNGKHFFLYEEVEEGSKKVTRNVIKVTDDYMELTKKGLVNVHMVFERDKKNVTYYYTPYGSLLVGIDAYIDVEYALEINNEHLANCHIGIKANPQGGAEFTLVEEEK
mgnify:CR=1 FL=1